MLSTSEKIVAKIEAKQLKPRPRWQFIVKKYSILTLTLTSLILGSPTRIGGSSRLIAAISFT
ncbi:MAG: hypothetical protein NTX66_04270 [Candidatus Falkowbacteria bacterium]|nr:hypothetical protein [Candidatus Falkowbacteria bacterium]